MSDKFGYNVLGFDIQNDKSYRTTVGNQGGVSYSLSTWINNSGVSIYNVDGTALATSAKQDTIIFDLGNISNNVEVDFGTRCGRGDFGTSIFYYTQWGENLALNAGVEEIICPWGGTFNPLTDIMSTPQTFDISYDAAFDGIYGIGARTLAIDYLDANYNYATSYHTLGGTGMDVSSFSGYGINRAYVLSCDTAATNQLDITFSASTDMTDQCVIPGGYCISNSIMYHIGVNRKILVDKMLFGTAKISGATPICNYYIYSFSRETRCRYLVKKFIMDTSLDTLIDIENNVPFQFTGKEVIYITGNSDKDNTVSNVRLGFRDLYL